MLGFVGSHKYLYPVYDFHDALTRHNELLLFVDFEKTIKMFAHRFIITKNPHYPFDVPFMVTAYA